MAVDRVENPLWIVFNVVEKEENIIVLIVEKKGK